MEKYNRMQQLKRSMFAMRNGVVADALRKAGSPFPIIFGLTLPQLSEIALKEGEHPAPPTQDNADFAKQVWANSTTRESMLIAPMLMPKDAMDEALALAWINEIPTEEVADVLCLKLLRHQPYALDLAKSLVADNDYMHQYTGLRLFCNLAPAHPELAVKIGHDFADSTNTRLRQMAEILLSYSE